MTESEYNVNLSNIKLFGIGSVGCRVLEKIYGNYFQKIIINDMPCGFGDTNDLQLKEMEQIKIKCAKKHFEAISSDKVKFEDVANFKELTNKLIYS
jgi:cell division GTPase FtsZ